MIPSQTLQETGKLRLPEFVTRRFSHPWMPMALYLPLGALLVALAQRSEPRSVPLLIAWILGGLVLWTLVEYLLHRFIFHLVQVKEPWRSLASGLHMSHHRTAETADLILAPPLVSLAFGLSLYLLFALLSWSWSRAGLLETGIFLGYLAYEWVHYSAHRFKPRSGLGKFLKHYHLRHHFKDPNRAFGVTTPLWDWVFGSSVSEESLKDSGGR